MVACGSISEAPRFPFYENGFHGFTKLVTPKGTLSPMKQHLHESRRGRGAMLYSSPIAPSSSYLMSLRRMNEVRDLKVRGVAPLSRSSTVRPVHSYSYGCCSVARSTNPCEEAPSSLFSLVSSSVATRTLPVHLHRHTGLPPPLRTREPWPVSIPRMLGQLPTGPARGPGAGGRKLPRPSWSCTAASLLPLPGYGVQRCVAG